MHFFPYRKIEVISYAPKDQVVSEFLNSLQMSPMKLFKNEKNKSFYGTFDGQNRFHLTRKRFERNSFAAEIVIKLFDTSDGTLVCIEFISPFLFKFFSYISLFWLFYFLVMGFIEADFRIFLFALVISAGIYLLGLIGYYIELDNSINEVNKVLKRIRSKHVS